MAAPGVTNKEGEDLAVPLPADWDLQALRTSAPVTYYGAKISPPCCKIRFMLQYYDVPFKTVNGKKPNSDYKKIPVLDVGDRQINDSYIIIKNMSPILAGRALTEDEEAFEKEVTFELMLALEKACARSTCSLCGCGRLMGGGTGCVLRCLAPCIACMVGPRMFKGKVLKTLPEYGSRFGDKLGSKPFFGGDEPSICDVSLFGVLIPFVAATDAADVFLNGHTSLRTWHEKMESKTSHIKIF